jgi:hypothetical protein
MTTSWRQRAEMTAHTCNFPALLCLVVRLPPAWRQMRSDRHPNSVAVPREEPFESLKTAAQDRSREETSVNIGQSTAACVKFNIFNQNINFSRDRLAPSNQAFLTRGGHEKLLELEGCFLADTKAILKSSLTPAQHAPNIALAANVSVLSREDDERSILLTVDSPPL